MNGPQFYMLALSACKVSPCRPTRDERMGVVLNHQDIAIGLKSWATIAESAEEAIAVGVGVAQHEWPASEGWENHTASWCVVERGELERMFGYYIASAPAEEGDDEADLVLM